MWELIKYIYEQIQLQDKQLDGMHSCKSHAGRLKSHQRGLDWNTLLCPGDLLSKSSKLTFPRKRWLGDRSPVNVRRVDEKHNVVRQADSGFGGGCSGNFRGSPWRLITPLLFVRLPSSWPLPWAGFLMLAPGSPVVRTLHSHLWAPRFNPWLGN